MRLALLRGRAIVRALNSQVEAAIYLMEAGFPPLMLPRGPGSLGPAVLDKEKGAGARC
jgi:hypothetical protein